MNRVAARPRIGFLTAGDARSRRYWSGIPYYMAKALEKHVGEVELLGPAEPEPAVTPDLHARVVRRLSGRQYDVSHSIRLARAYSDIFSRKVARRRLDVIFAPVASTEIACLDTTVPIAYASDVTFALIHNYYPRYSNLQRRSVREGNWIESSALRKARMIFYPTEWAAASAVKDYGIEKQNIRVIPYGANVDAAPPRDAALAPRAGARCRLLFIGVEWERKGGPIAFETLIRLSDLDIPAELIVCGCTPPPEFAHPDMRVIPFIDKNQPDGRELFTRLMREATLFLLPTRQECFGIVFCEAAAFGLPVVSTDTGGVSEVVRQGQNGIVLPYHAGGGEYAAAIAELLQETSQLRRLQVASRTMFEERLNWDVWATEVGKALRAVL